MENGYIKKQRELLRKTRIRIIRAVCFSICLPLLLSLASLFGLAKNVPPEKWETETFTLQNMEREYIADGRRGTRATTLHGTNGKSYVIKLKQADEILEIGKAYTVSYHKGLIYLRVEAISSDGEDIVSYDEAVSKYNKNYNTCLTIFIITLVITISILVVALVVYRDNFRLIKKYKSNIKEKLNKL